MTNLIFPHNVSAYSSKIVIQSVANQVRNKSSIDKKYSKKNMRVCIKRIVMVCLEMGQGLGGGGGADPAFPLLFCMIKSTI